MTIDDVILLEEYQRLCAREMDTDIDLLTDTIDRMTTNGKTREGRQILRANRHQLVEAMKKLHDIFVEMEGT
jgi:hypothetical protein